MVFPNKNSIHIENYLSEYSAEITKGLASIDLSELEKITEILIHLLSQKEQFSLVGMVVHRQ